MNLFTISAGQVSSSVWTNTTRTLTATLEEEINSEGINGTATSSAVQNTLGAYVQVVASTAHAVRGVQIVMASPDAGFSCLLVVSTGAAASEVVKMNCHAYLPATAIPGIAVVRFVDPTLIPKGVRVAIAIANTGAAAARNINFSIDLLEDNS